MLAEMKIDMQDEFSVHLVAAGAAQSLLPIITPIAADMGLEIIRLRLTGDGKQPILQIMAQHPDGTMTIADCERLSRAISVILDVEDPIAGQYILEVSSAGMARPLTRPKDFTDWAGYEIVVKLSEGVEMDGHLRRKFQGLLEGFVDNEVRLRVELDGYDEPQILGFGFLDILDAKLVMNDKIIKSAFHKKERT